MTPLSPEISEELSSTVSCDVRAASVSANPENEASIVLWVRRGRFLIGLHVLCNSFIPTADATGHNFFKLFLRSEIADKAHLKVLAVNVAVEIEQVNLQNALSFAAHSWPTTKVHYARINSSIQLRFGEINAVWRKLLAVRAQIRRGEPDFLSEIVAVDHCPKNRVFAAEHFGRFCKGAFFNRLPNGRAADDAPIFLYRQNSDNLEIGLRAQSLQEIEVPASIFAERPLVTDTDFAKGLGMID